ncbi:MAG: hypothetical protein H6926_07080 [Chromatiales bacterium]|nr:hypothetical protein [Chromatiales bacterium]
MSNFELFGVAANTALVDAVRTSSLAAAASANGLFPDHVYDFGALDALNNIAHTASSLTLSIVATAGQNWPNEAYAIDNLAVSINATASTVPAPPTGLATILGLTLMRRLSRRQQR